MADNLQKLKELTNARAKARAYSKKKKERTNRQGYSHLSYTFERQKPSSVCLDRRIKTPKRSLFSLF